MNIDNKKLDNILTWWSGLKETYEPIDENDSNDIKNEKLIEFGKLCAYEEIIKELDIRG